MFPNFRRQKPDERPTVDWPALEAQLRAWSQQRGLPTHIWQTQQGSNVYDRITPELARSLNDEAIHLARQWLEPLNFPEAVNAKSVLWDERQRRTEMQRREDRRLNEWTLGAAIAGAGFGLVSMIAAVASCSKGH